MGGKPWVRVIHKVALKCGPRGPPYKAHDEQRGNVPRSRAKLSRGRSLGGATN